MTIRWVRGLHNLYLATLLIALLTTVVVQEARAWTIAVMAAMMLAAADLLARRQLPTQPVLIAYFATVAAVLGVLTTRFPTFAAVAFGALPLAFVYLPWLAALAVGTVLTGLPYVMPASLNLRIGPVYLAMVGVALPILTGLFTARVIRSRQDLVEKLSSTRAELAAAARREGQSEERRRLAHELHDTLAQGLTGVLVQLEAAQQDAGRCPPAVGERLARAQETARRCLTDTRRAVAALRPESLDGAGLAGALRSACLRWPVARLSMHGQPRPVHPEAELVALRVVQESLANAAKHAVARQVDVTLSYAPGELRVSVSDDGCGFDPESLPPCSYGLVTMRERVDALRGSLTVVSSPGCGTTVMASLPCDEGQ